MNVGDRTIERAAQRVALGGDAAKDRARALGESRPELVAYVLHATGELSPAARAAAWVGFELVCAAMNATAKPRVPIARLLEVEAQNDELALSLGVAHPRFAARWLRHGGRLRQRTMLARLARDVTTRVPAGERGAVFHTLKTVVDVLDEE